MELQQYICRSIYDKDNKMFYGIIQAISTSSGQRHISLTHKFVSISGEHTLTISREYNNGQIFCHHTLEPHDIKSVSFKRHWYLKK